MIIKCCLNVKAKDLLTKNILRSKTKTNQQTHWKKITVPELLQCTKHLAAVIENLV